MTAITSMTTYRNRPLGAVSIDGETWLRSGPLVPAFGLTDERSIRKIYERHRDAFGDEDTRLIRTPTEGGEQEVRVFSIHGARLLAILARTPEAMRFQRWLLDVVEGRVSVGARHPVAALPTESQLILNDLATLAPAGSPIAGAIEEYARGRRGLPSVGPLAALRAERASIVDELRLLNRRLHDCHRRARRLGYTPETLKWQPPQPAEGLFDVADSAG